MKAAQESFDTQKKKKIKGIVECYISVNTWIVCALN
jgi:hypothetical protein